MREIQGVQRIVQLLEDRLEERKKARQDLQRAVDEAALQVAFALRNFDKATESVKAFEACEMLVGDFQKLRGYLPLVRKGALAALTDLDDARKTRERLIQQERESEFDKEIGALTELVALVKTGKSEMFEASEFLEEFLSVDHGRS